MGFLLGRITRTAARVAAAAALSSAIASVLHAQAGGTIQGKVTKASNGTPLAGAVVHIKGTTLGARTGDDGSYAVPNAPAGSDTLQVRADGFATDSFVVNVAAGATVDHNIAMRLNVATLTAVRVEASPRLNETVEAARTKQKDAPNLVNVLSGDEIRSLPALNAAEASERIPGVTTERDEGEGKFVQIRGTEPTLQNVTVNGVHVPGTLSGDRSVKLDDIPSDIIGAIEVSKTLTADMDADAIGGSVNIVSKVPEGKPRGYISGQYGITSPAVVNSSSRTFAAGQGSIFYGGRTGANQKLGFLIGGSFDRNDRPIQDLEPSWGATASPDNQARGAFFPTNYDMRIYRYFRQRYGADAELDYRFSENSSVFLKGLYSQFLNHGYRYVWSLGANNDGAGGFGINGTSSKNVSNRTPNEQLYGATVGGKSTLGPFQVDVAATAGGTVSSESDYRTSTYQYNGPVTYKYDASNIVKPKFTIPDPLIAAAVLNPANYFLHDYNLSSDVAQGLDAGGALNLLAHYDLGSSASGIIKFGARYRNEQKSFVNRAQTFNASLLGPITMDQLIGNMTDPNYYRNVFTVNTGTFASVDRTTAYENSHPQFFVNMTDPLANLASNYFGRERISAAYAMNEFTFGGFHLNTGLRVEQTQLTYTGYPLLQDDAGTSVSTAAVTASNSYTDLFPSAQVRWEVDPNTNFRLAFTRGIARAAYADLAPHLTGSRCSVTLTCAPATNPNNFTLSAGNPNLKPETAWDYDLLFEHFLPRAGVVSAGVFYKDLHDFIFDHRFFNYQGPVVQFHGAGGSMPDNGRNAHIYGVEADFSQHFTFLPGAWAGLGFDVNWTHVESRTSYQVDSVTVRHGLLPRTSPNIGNASLLYDHGRVNARFAWVYQGAMLASTGGNAAGDGSSFPNSGDTYFYAHSQFDASVQYAVSNATTLQLQLLNINNAVFGFFTGTLSHQYDTQREYYGPTVYLGVRQGF